MPTLTYRVWKADFLLILTAAVWGLGFVAQRNGMRHMGPFFFNALRFALGGMVLLPLIVRGPHRVPEKAWGRAGAWMGGFIVGVALFLGGALQQAGLVTTSAANAGFLTSLYLVLVPLLERLWGKKVPLKNWIGAGVALLGSYYISVSDNFTVGRGDIYVLLGALVWSVHFHLLSWLTQHVESKFLAFVQFLSAALFSYLVALGVESTAWEMVWNARWAVFYCGAISVGIGYTFQVVAQRDAPPTHVAILLSLESVFGALSGYWFLGERLTGRAVFGCVVLFMGVMVATLWPREEG